jgi:hypothetical protein
MSKQGDTEEVKSVFGGDVLKINVNYDVRVNHEAFVAKANQVLTFLEQVIPGQVRYTLIGKVISEAVESDGESDLLITFKVSNYGQEYTVLNVSKGRVAKEAVFEV